MPRANSTSGRFAVFAAAGVLFSVVAGGANADIIWNEQIDGDFSDDRFFVTPLTLADGNNSIAARIEAEDAMGNLDLDYFSVTIAPGFQLAEIFLENYMSSDFVAFIAIDQGPMFSIAPEDASIENLFGWLHFGAADVGRDILGPMGLNGRGGGFTAPLPAGTYSFWAQQIGTFTEYAPVFVVEAVPTPGSLTLLVLGGFVLATRRKR